MPIAVLAAALGVVAPARAQQKTDAVQATLNDAAAALQRGLIDQSIQFYSDALADKGLSNDRRAVIHADRGAAHMRKQAMKPAIDDFNRAVQLSPEYAAAYNNRGNALIAVGALREAIKDFDRAIVLSPSYGAAFANRASAHVRLGNLELSLADYTRAIELTPQSVSALNGRGLLHLGADRPHAASRDFSRALSLDLRFAAGYRNRASAMSALERKDDAIEDLSRAITFDARNVDSHLVRAEAYLIAANPKAALADYNKAIELDPKYARAYAVRVWVYRQLGQPDLAQKDMERGLKLEPVSADAYWAQGELEDARGRNEAAIQAFTKALGVDPRHRMTLDALSRLGLVATREESEVTGAGADGWLVLQTGDQYVAIHPQFAKLRVPLEMLAKGTPRIIGFERQKSPYANFGLLRFAAGKLELPGRPAEDLETAAIIDIGAQATLGLTLSKRGGKTANWSWEDNRLLVSSADGLSEEFVLKGAKGTAVAAVAPEKGSRREGGSNANPRSSSSSGGTPPWAPWSQQSGSSKQASRPPKQKSIFELLFGN